MQKIAVVIPCHNEELTIGKVVKDFRTSLPEAIIAVCDNASSDNTAKVAEKAGAQVIFNGHLGKGNAVKTLFKEVDADAYILVDGDDTYEANDAPLLISKLNEGNDMVIADRLSGTYYEINERRFHNQGNWLVKTFINIIFDSNIKDVMSGYRILSKRFIDNYPISCDGFELETDMTIHALNYKFNIAQIYTTYRNRPDCSESKLSTYKDGTKIIRTIFKLFMNYKPLKFFSIISLILLILSVILFIPVLQEYFITGLVPRFPTLIVSGFLFIMSILLFCIGLILNSQAVKNRFLFDLLLLKYDKNNK